MQIYTLECRCLCACDAGAVLQFWKTGNSLEIGSNEDDSSGEGVGIFMYTHIWTGAYTRI